MTAQVHIPVLKDEVLDILPPSEGGTLLDCTVGHGGHSVAWLNKAGSEAKVIGLDADSKALAQAAANLEEFGNRVELINANFSRLKDVVPKNMEFTHCLFDLGIGSHQLEDEGRGFSFASSSSLSMRYGDDDNLPESNLTSLNRLQARLNRLPDVSDLLTRLSAEELAEIIRQFGEDKFAKRIATTLKEQEEPIEDSGQLARTIADAVPNAGKEKIHPATRGFQAFRLAVNRELEALEAALPQAVDLLAPGGIVAVISFHSLEDRIVKNFFKQQSSDCECPPEFPTCQCSITPNLEIITKKPVQADSDEIETNPRARSAKLRAARKLTQRGP